jgi:hypothetical protein
VFLGYFLLIFYEDRTVPCLKVHVSLMEHAIQRYVLASAPIMASA